MSNLRQQPTGRSEMLASQQHRMNLPPEAAIFGATRIRGRRRGFETIWTPERFAEVLRKDVGARLERSWPPERICAWVRDAYGVDDRSVPQMQRVLDAILTTLRSEPTEPGEVGRRPRQLDRQKHR